MGLLLLSTSLALAQPVRFYLGTYTEKSSSQGIYTGTLDTSSGQMSPLTLAASMVDPNYLALSPDQKFLYACTSTNGGSIAAFQVSENGQLTFLNQLASGKECCHVSVDATGKNVLAANYFADSVVCFQTKPDGSLSERTELKMFSGTGPDHDRQDRPHLHSIYVDAANRHVYSCDLGTDNLWFFRLNARAGRLEQLEPASFKVSPGSGPRHLAFSPDEHFVYVNGEMGMNVSVFTRAHRSGKLKLVQTIGVLPPEVDPKGMATAEIVYHPSGKWLYVSNRDVTLQGRDSVTVFAVGADGKLTWVQAAPALVKVPRGFGIDPTGHWLMVGGQADSQLAVLKIDPDRGTMSATGQIVSVGSPVCVIFQKPAKR